MGWVFHVNIHIFVLKYLVQIQIIQNQFKISEGGKWNSHQMPCVYSSRMVKNYRICPIRIEIIHGRHRVVQICTWAGPLYAIPRSGPRNLYSHIASLGS
jgi:hypothetical protein